MVFYLIHFQEHDTVFRQFDRTGQRVCLPCEQIGTGSVEISVICCEICIRSIDRNKDTFGIALSFKNQLVIGDYDIFVSAVTKSVAVLTKRDQFFQKVREFIRYRRFKRRAECIIVIGRFFTEFPSFTSIVNARNTGHTKENTVCKRQMIFIC